MLAWSELAQLVSFNHDLWPKILLPINLSDGACNTIEIDRERFMEAKRARLAENEHRHEAGCSARKVRAVLSWHVPIYAFQEIANRVELAAAGSGQVLAHNRFAKMDAKLFMH